MATGNAGALARVARSSVHFIDDFAATMFVLRARSGRGRPRSQWEV